MLSEPIANAICSETRYVNFRRMGICSYVCDLYYVDNSGVVQGSRLLSRNNTAVARFATEAQVR